MNNNNLADRLFVALDSRNERAMRQAFEDIRAAGLRFAVEFRSGLIADNEDWIIRTALINNDAPVAAAWASTFGTYYCTATRPAWATK